MIVNAYLSREHFDDRDGSCPMITLPSDVVRGGKGVKTAFRQVLDKMSRCLPPISPNRKLESDYLSTRAWKFRSFRPNSS
jgi:hypothetical protein